MKYFICKKKKKKLKSYIVDIFLKHKQNKCHKMKTDNSDLFNTDFDYR